MFILSMPKTFAVGNAADAEINGRSASVTWTDAETLRIGSDDSRRILTKTESDDLITFYCSDAPPQKYALNADDTNLYRISDRNGRYVKSISGDGPVHYEYTHDLDEAALFDPANAIMNPIVEADHKPSFYFDPA